MSLMEAPKHDSVSLEKTKKMTAANMLASLMAPKLNLPMLMAMTFMTVRVMSRKFSRCVLSM